MEFVVDRRTWFRGHGANQSSLFREDCTKCCLGFLALSCGYSETEIEDRATPIAVGSKGVLFPKEFPVELNNFPKFLFEHVHNKFRDSAVSLGLMEINDDPTLAEDVREQMLIEGFAKHDINLRFEN
jgi:hypothetical protein